MDLQVQKKNAEKLTSLRSIHF